MIIERYCTCGAVLKTVVNRRKAQQVNAVWYSMHFGIGHTDTTADIAEAARMGTNTGMGRESREVQDGKR